MLTGLQTMYVILPHLHVCHVSASFLSSEALQCHLNAENSCTYHFVYWLLKAATNIPDHSASNRLSFQVIDQILMRIFHLPHSCCMSRHPRFSLFDSVSE